MHYNNWFLHQKYSVLQKIIWGFSAGLLSSSSGRKWRNVVFSSLLSFRPSVASCCCYCSCFQQHCTGLCNCHLVRQYEAPRSSFCLQRGSNCEEAWTIRIHVAAVGVLRHETPSSEVASHKSPDLWPLAGRMAAKGESFYACMEWLTIQLCMH